MIYFRFPGIILFLTSNGEKQSLAYFMKWQSKNNIADTVNSCMGMRACLSTFSS